MIDFTYYLITDRTQCASETLAVHIEKACEAGLKAVQLREKDLTDRELFEMAKKLREITGKYDTRLFINERTDVAMMVGADGVQARENGMPVDEIKNLDSDLWVGASVHTLESAKQAEKKGADFILFGPIFETPSKRGYGKPQGVVALQEIAQFMKIPVFAVGGIDRDKAERCLDYDADGLAGISSVMDADDPAEVLSSYKKIMGRL